jgi:hypothetical protein
VAWVNWRTGAKGCSSKASKLATFRLGFRDTCETLAAKVARDRAIVHRFSLERGYKIAMDLNRAHPFQVEIEHKRLPV